MLLPFSIRVAEWRSVSERAVYLVKCTCLSWAVVKFCECPSFSFGIEGGMWDVIVLIPDHCLSTLRGIKIKGNCKRKSKLTLPLEI